MLLTSRFLSRARGFDRRCITCRLASSASAKPIEAEPDSEKRKPRKQKPEIFTTKDIVKKSKIHLKPSLLSKAPGKESTPSTASIKGNLALEPEPEYPPETPPPKLDSVYDSEEMHHQLPEALVSVESFFLARSIDLKALASEPSLNIIPSRNHVVIKLEGGNRSREDYTPMPGCLSNERMVVVFQYGSVVLFNLDEFSFEKNSGFISIVRKHSKEVITEPKKENYRVVVIPEMDRWSRGGSDKIMLKKLDMDGIRIISLILGQSIALDHYTRSIDEMLNTFGELNRHMELTGTFNMKRKPLFKLVAAANAALADAILRLGLLERSDAAWQSAKYDRIWEYLREDFELDDRFESLEFKTGIIQHNVKFFLDILQNRKSDTLEWIIILLIAGEICVSLYDILRGTEELFR